MQHNVTMIEPKLRRIQPMADFKASNQITEGLGKTPKLMWVEPRSLLIDAAYQRDLTQRSRNLINKMIVNFAWRKMKPPIVVEVAGGFHCIDGQHTAIAAATRGIPTIPVFVVEAATQQERADSFVAHNRDRVVMSPFDVYRAKLAAQDTDAMDVASVCQRAGVKLKVINPQARIDVGDTACVGTVQGMIKRQGVKKARMVLEALVQGGRAPISAPEIAAVEAAMVLVRPTTTVDEMSAVIRAIGDHGVVEARATAATEGKPQKHVLFHRYMEILEKQTGQPRSIAS